MEYNLTNHLELRLANTIDLCLTRRLAMLALRVGPLITHRPSNNIRLGLLIDDETLGPLESCKSFLFDTVHQVVASGDVVDETDDLAGGPYL